MRAEEMEAWSLDGDLPDAPSDHSGSEHPRLHKWLADAGLCSRREAEEWIAAGRVSLNGHKVTKPGAKVGPQDLVAVDGNAVERGAPARMAVVLYKPVGVICTRHDPDGRRTIFDLLPQNLPRLNNVGRLDINSEGLLLLTNDGGLAHKLTHPSTQVPRTYRVKVHGRLNEERIAELRQTGVMLEDGPTGPLAIALDRSGGANSWITLTLHEGRNREIRRIFETLEMSVARLIRIAFGGVTLGDMQPGTWRPLTQAERARLRQVIASGRGKKG
ncbi:putative ribosomal large subunit pseudouridine synthase B [Magnetofaba australis IT-1]|uniref:Pseudouridine synthase n=1 Tax=Magnetofaba australis IT-1 TaxID=1434232 RepID=A0A1Y2K5N9_9PROT|nr:putative ribosomal large subunit pseudouridine synthase B [Magnetofaba australis IT-1]